MWSGFFFIFKFIQGYFILLNFIDVSMLLSQVVASLFLFVTNIISFV